MKHIIGRCMMEKMKMCHRNLAESFYDYKKVHDKMHHGWILENLLALLNELMRRCNTRFEIWSNGDTRISRWMYGFLQSRILSVRDVL